MSNAVAIRGSAQVATYTAAANPFLEAAKGVNDLFGSRLKVDGNTGDLVIGPKDDGDTLPKGSYILVDLLHAEHGHLCWVEGALKDEDRHLITVRPTLPDIKDLPDHGPYKKDDDGEDGWQKYINFRAREERDGSLENGDDFTFDANSSSAIRAVKTLLKEFGQKFVHKIGADGAYQYPVVQIDVNGFKIKDKPRLGTKYAPTFKIVDWIDASVAEKFFLVGEAAAEEDEDNYEPTTDTQQDADPEDAANYDEGDGSAEDSGNYDDNTVEDAQVEEVRAPTRAPAREQVQERAPAREAAPARAAPQERAPARDPAPTREAAPVRRTTVAHAAPQDADDNVDAGIATSREAAPAGGRRTRARN